MGANFSNRGESIFVISNGYWQSTAASQCGLTLRRYYGWGGAKGYLEAIWQGLNGQLRYVQVPYENKRMFDWRHVAVAWSVKEKRLELYLDGKLAGMAAPGKDDWLAAPWDSGKPGKGLVPLTRDHGRESWTDRDEWYIYKRVLKPEEILANMGKAKK